MVTRQHSVGRNLSIELGPVDSLSPVPVDVPEIESEADCKNDDRGKDARGPEVRAALRASKALDHRLAHAEDVDHPDGDQPDDAQGHQPLAVRGIRLQVRPTAPEE